MATETIVTPALADALVILAAAGIVIPTFARFRINPVIGFILVGIVAGPFGLGSLAAQYPWLESVSIADAATIEPFAELGIVLLLFSIGLELSFRRLLAMRRQVFGIGAAEMVVTAALIGGFLTLIDWPTQSAVWLALALAMSSTALVLPISGTQSPVGRAALAMLLFEDLALVPMLFLIGAAGGAASQSLGRVAIEGTLVIAAILLVGRFVLPALFAQAARSKKPELFLAISLLVVILAATLTAAVGLSPILGALVAGLVIAETEYRSEVEVVTEPFKGLALGVFLITVGMRIDVGALLDEWPMLLGALAAVILVKAIVTGALLRMVGATRGVAAETGLLMASPSETTLIVLGAAGVAGILGAETVAFWSAATAIGLTITPLLASLGRLAARRVDREGADTGHDSSAAGRTVIFGFGRVGRMVADMLSEHDRAYLAVDSDIDGFRQARKAGYSVLYGDVSRRELIEKLELGEASAVVLTMDDPVLTARIARRLRTEHPDLPIIARARDTAHAAALYKAGVTDAVPEAVEASLQLSEAVLVDIGVAMGPVIASIHEKRSELRSEIMEAGNLESEPTLGRRRLRDSKPA
ncbi:cation:proton antiporter [Sphingomonas sp. LY29]|uniref:cation:proton antiporter domain-containing protein n=1 Tax=unclassified Sphingomonas TaxID=196159 RepID=UPI002ADEB4B1|nr:MULTISPECIES: cation:proton antiporter [unclassified Sphingomonas]MEA1071115.1 cation:proton antiporter [Sphingomonas sp. LY160]WRP26163.1 cation:proton antiporter [Sphingomonas sp. LY29]